MKLLVGVALVAALLWPAWSEFGFGSAGSVDGPVLALSEKANRTLMQAGLSGVVAHDARNGCLYLGSGPSRTPIVWPPGTSWDEDLESVRLRNGTLIEPGATISGGGGSADVDSVRRVAGDRVAARVVACGEDAVLVQSNIEVTQDSQ